MSDEERFDHECICDCPDNSDRHVIADHREVQKLLEYRDEDDNATNK